MKGNIQKNGMDERFRPLKGKVLKTKKNSIKSFFNLENFYSSKERALAVSFFTDVASLIYHIFILFTFLSLRVYPMVYYNIFSVSVFSGCLFFLRKTKTLERLYYIACIEVIIHQVLADYFLGTQAKFHYFILLMGILPFMIFDRKALKTTVVSAILTTMFIYYENLEIFPKYEISETMLLVIQYINITITIFIIVIMLLIFTKIVENVEDHLTSQNHALEKEISLATTIQQNFFKQNVKTLKDWDIAYYSKPMLGVSGDLYDFYKKDSELKGFGIFDVSGHGISSGLVTMLVKNIIFHEFYNGSKLDVWEIMNKINDRVIAEKGDIENYLTGILVRINGNNLEMVNAAHPAPIWFKYDEGMAYFVNSEEAAKGAIGLPDFPAVYISQNIELKSGDFMLFYSDGLTDMTNEDGVSFGKERLMRLVELLNQLNPERQIDHLQKALEKFRGEHQQNDDVTFIVIRKK